MPRTSVFFAGHCRRRVRLYFGSLIKQHAESKNRVGSLVQVPASRIARWASGDRLVTPEKAFELGDALRRELGWPTSGIEFLWACGYWPEILEILKHLATDAAPDGPALAAMLYAWLPNKMWDFELRNIDQRFAEDFGIANFLSHVDRLRDAVWFLQSGVDEDNRFVNVMGYASAMGSLMEPLQNKSPVIRRILEERINQSVIHLLDSDPGAQEVWLFVADDRPRTFEELDQRCQCAGAHAQISRAWERSQYPGRLDKRPSPRSGQRGEAAGKTGVLSDIQTYVIDALADGASKLNNEIFPTYAIPPIWRMLSGWAYGIDRQTTSNWIAALPDNFVNVPDAFRRAEERQARRDADEVLDDELANHEKVLEEMARFLQQSADLAVDGGAVITVDPMDSGRRSRLSVFRGADTAPIASVVLERSINLVIDRAPSKTFRLHVRADGSWSTSSSRSLMAASTYALKIDRSAEMTRRDYGFDEFAIVPNGKEQHTAFLARALTRWKHIFDDEIEREALTDLISSIAWAKRLAVDGGSTITICGTSDGLQSTLSLSRTWAEDAPPVATYALERPVSLAIDGAAQTAFRLYVSPEMSISHSATRALLATSTYELSVGKHKFAFTSTDFVNTTLFEVGWVPRPSASE